MLWLMRQTFFCQPFKDDIEKYENIINTEVTPVNHTTDYLLDYSYL